MRLILAEKPSQARDIAKAFKNCKSREGYIECAGGWFIIWAFGHLFEIDTEKIFPFGRILEFPEKFEYRLISRSHAKQFKVIKNGGKDA
jgi:DNA topoisomerase IA